MTFTHKSAPSLGLCFWVAAIRTGVFNMPLIAVSLIWLISCSITPYARAALGYKYQENEIPGNNVCDSNISVRIEAGIITERFIYGWSHHGQPLCGRSFNDEYEPFKSEFLLMFIRHFNQAYCFSLSLTLS